IKSSRDTQYGKYIKLIENLKLIFTQLKNKMSIKRFKKNFNRLSKKEKEEIEREYSFEIYDKEPK
ncbi:MAG: hypothetical protein ACWIPI_09315, partial [Polaribacter sp.]